MALIRRAAVWRPPFIDTWDSTQGRDPATGFPQLNERGIHTPLDVSIALPHTMVYDSQGCVTVSKNHYDQQESSRVENTEAQSGECRYTERK